MWINNNGDITMIKLHDTKCSVCGSTGTTVVKLERCIKCNSTIMNITERQVSKEGWYDF